MTILADPRGALTDRCCLVLKHSQSTNGLEVGPPDARGPRGSILFLLTKRRYGLGVRMWKAHGRLLNFDLQHPGDIFRVDLSLDCGTTI